jgi:hypothetical protein
MPGLSILCEGEEEGNQIAFAIGIVDKEEIG